MKIDDILSGEINNIHAIHHFFDNYIGSIYGNSTFKIKEIFDDINKKLNNDVKNIYLQPSNLDDMKKSLDSATNNIVYMFGTSKHAMTFTLYIENNNAYFTLINSGDGVQLYDNNHDKKNEISNLWLCLKFDIMSEEYNNFKENLAMLLYVIIGINYSDDVSVQLYTFTTMPNASKIFKIIHPETHTKDAKKHDRQLYYIYSFLDEYGANKVGNFRDNITIKNFINKWNSYAPINDTIKEYIYSNRNFVYDEKTNILRTNQQNSGSCSWYSMLWAYFHMYINILKKDFFIIFDEINKKCYADIVDLSKTSYMSYNYLGLYNLFDKTNFFKNGKTSINYINEIRKSKIDCSNIILNQKKDIDDINRVQSKIYNIIENCKKILDELRNNNYVFNKQSEKYFELIEQDADIFYNSGILLYVEPILLQYISLSIYYLIYLGCNYTSIKYIMYNNSHANTFIADIRECLLNFTHDEIRIIDRFMSANNTSYCDISYDVHIKCRTILLDNLDLDIIISNLTDKLKKYTNVHIVHQEKNTEIMLNNQIMKKLLRDTHNKIEKGDDIIYALYHKDNNYIRDMSKSFIHHIFPNICFGKITLLDDLKIKKTEMFDDITTKNLEMFLKYVISIKLKSESYEDFKTKFKKDDVLKIFNYSSLMSLTKVKQISNISFEYDGDVFISAHVEDFDMFNILTSFGYTIHDNLYISNSKNKIIINKYIYGDAKIDKLTILLEISNNVIEKVYINEKISEFIIDKTYPFVIYCPNMGYNFIINDDDKYKIITLFTDCFSMKRFLFDFPKDYSCLLLDISNNLLTLENDFETYSKMFNIYNDYGGNKIFFVNENNNLNEEIDKINIKENKQTNFLEGQYIDDLKEILEPIKNNYNFIESSKYILSSFNNEVTEQDLNNFIKKHPICKFKCEKNNLQNNRNLIIEKIKIYQAKIKDVCKLINHNNHNNLFNLLINNVEQILQIVILNTILFNLKRILDISNNCDDDLTCKEYAEIADMMKFPKKDKNLVIKTLIEIAFGYMLTEEQSSKIDDIVNNFDEYIKNPITKCKIYHFMMGKGKSSVITPFIILFAKIKTNKAIHIVVPAHLLKQTNDTIQKYIYVFGLSKVYVGSDVEYKNKLINNNFSQDDIYIYDEFDMMYDPLQSNYNIVSKSIPWLTEELYNEMFDIIDNPNISKKNKIYKLVADVLSNKNIKNITYGMSKYMQEHRYVIPYIRKDTPIEGAEFNSIINTIVLTILYFKELNYELEPFDFLVLLYSKDTYIFKFSEFYNNQDVPMYISNSIKLQKSTDIEIRKQYVKKYIYRYCLKNIEISSEIQNCSFVDIMNYSSNWTIGYTGTVNIPFPDFNNQVSKFDKNIKIDTDEKIGVYCAITGNYENSKNTIYNIQQSEAIDEIYNILNKDKIYNVLIDISGVFKDFKNMTVIEKILSLDKYKDKYCIFVDDNDEKIIYSNVTGYNKFDNTIYDTSKIFYYYSQKNIVGIDLKQPTRLLGLAIISEDNRYTEVAQGIYRMRKLNRGHVCDIVYISSNKYTSEQIYNKIIENDFANMKYKTELIKFQYLKQLIRKVSKKYNEIDIIPPYARQIEISNSQMMKNIFDVDIEKYDKTSVEYTLYKYFEESKDILEMVMYGGSSVKTMSNTKTLQQHSSYVEKKIKFIEKSIGSYYIINPIKFDQINEITYSEKIENINLRLTLDCFEIDEYIIKGDNMYNYNEYYFIVKLQENDYLLVTNLHMGMYIFTNEIYTLSGKKINNKYISGEENINIPNLLKYFINGIVFDEDIETIKNIIDNLTILSALFIFCNIYKITNNIEIRNYLNKFTDKETNILLRKINDFKNNIVNFFKEKNIEYFILENSFNKTQNCDIIQVDKKIQVIHSISILNYQEGGNNNYSKYIKFMKYINRLTI